MNFRPLQVLLLTLLAAALILTACQAAPQTPTAVIEATPPGGTPPRETAATLAPTVERATKQPTAAPTDALGAELADLEGVTIDFWHPWQADVAAQAEAAVDEFNRANEWGLRVRIRSFYGASALIDAVNTGRAMEDGEFPEVVAASSEQLAGWALEDPPLVVDLTPYAGDLQVGLSDDEVAAYQPVFWEQDSLGERRLGLPALRNARVLFYNRTWAEDLGFTEAPTTPAAFKQQACAAAQENNAARSNELYGTGGWLIDTDPLTTLSWLGAFGADPIPAQDGQQYEFESPEAEEALQFLRGLVNYGCAWIGRSLDEHEYFALRRALFYSGNLPEIYDQTRWQEHAGSADQWTVIPFPGEDGQPLVFSAGHSYAVTTITGTSDEERLAGWLFARWMTQPRIAAKLAQALPSLPVSEPVAAQLSDYRNNSPWSQIMPLMDGLRPAPSLASWRQARRLLEDAAWQVYHLPPESLPEVLPHLDEAVDEWISKTGY